jgi:hypothetical protein
VTSSKGYLRSVPPTLDISAKTVVRGGFGIYYDTELLYRRLQERAFIGPVGNGRIQFPATGFTNIFPGIVDINLGGAQGGAPVPVGAPLPSGHIINLTLGQYLQIQQQQAPIIAAQFAPQKPQRPLGHQHRYQQSGRATLSQGLSRAARPAFQPRGA